MTSLSKNKVAKKRGRPLGSKNKKADEAIVMSFKRRGRPRKVELPLGATSWEDAYKKTLKNLERAYERLVEFHDVYIKLEQVDRLQVGRVAHHVVLVADAIAAQHVPRLPRGPQADGARVALHHGDGVGRAGARLPQAAPMPSSSRCAPSWPFPRHSQPRRDPAPC